VLEGIIAIGIVSGAAYENKKWKMLLPIRWKQISHDRPLPVSALKKFGITDFPWGFRGDMVLIDPEAGERIKRIFEANLYPH
jgi:hypothetical protein